MGAGEVLGKEPRGQAEFRIVGDLDGFGFAPETDHRQDRAEELVGQARSLRYPVTIQNGGREVKTVSIQRLAACDQPCTLFHGGRHQPFSGRHLTRGAERAHLGRHLVRRADHHSLGLCLEPGKEGVLDARLHHQARPRDVALAAGRKEAGHLRVHRAVQIRIVKNDKGRFSAQLQRGGGQIFRRVSHDVARGFRTAGSGDMGHLGVRGQGRADLRPAGNHVQHAGRKPGLVEQTGEPQHWRGAILGRFQHHRATRRQRRADLDRGQEQLRIPGHHGGDHANGFAAQPDLHIRLVDGQMCALDLVGKPGVVAVVFRA